MQTQDQIAVSIVVVNWKVREMLRSCLCSLYELGGLAPRQFEVIVVDNDSRDGSVEMVREKFPSITVIANERNVGFGRANNQALPLCRGRYVLLLNPDTVVLDQSVSRLVARMDACADVGAMGCRLINADGSLQRWTGGAFPRLANVLAHYLFVDRLLPARMRPLPLYLDRDERQEIDVDWVSGACLIARASALDGKLFNPDFFMYGEDMELCHRLKLAGWRIVYTPRATIVHYQGESMRQQSGDVLLSAIKGPRQFYLQMRGGRAIRTYDAITVAGFGLRWLLYRIGAALSNTAGYRDKAESSRDLMRRAWRIMRA